MPAAHTGGHYARQPRGGCGWPRTLRLITSSMRQGEHGTTCGECVECDAREGPQKVGPWLVWGWEACVSRAQHERTYERTVVLTAATLWQGPEDRIDGVQEPLTGSTFYRVATLAEYTRHCVDRGRPLSSAHEELFHDSFDQVVVDVHQASWCVK